MARSNPPGEPAGPSMPVDLIDLDTVIIDNRFRVRLGDLDELTASIGTVGLLCPIGVDLQRRLLYGHRRLEACRSLGWSRIPAVVLTHLDDAVTRLVAERDENTCRLPMAPSELMRLGMAIAELEGPAAEARMRHGGQNGAAARWDALGSREPTPSTGRTAAKVGQALGVSAATFKRGKRLLSDAADPELSTGQREAAAAAVAEMDATGAITGPYERYVRTQRRLAAVPVKRALRGSVGTAPMNGSAAKQAQVIGAVANQLGGMSYALRDLDTLHPDLTAEQAAAWHAEIVAGRRHLSRLTRLLKERAHA